MDRIASLTEAVYRTLGCLAEAKKLAIDAEEDLRQFAVEKELLQTLGLGLNELRWLIMKKFILHLYETTLGGEAQRHFRETSSTKIVESSCFLITDAGYEVWESSEISAADVPTCAAPEVFTTHQLNPVPLVIKPVWDADRQELSLAGEIVKRFRLPSANQIAVLASFEEEGWPRRIFDPLPGTPYLDSKRRLQDTIKGLNRSQRIPLLQFQGDGTGEGVVWELRNVTIEPGTQPLAAYADVIRRSG